MSTEPAPLVEPFDRGSYLVRSARNQDDAYVVDLEEGTCSCPHGLHLPEGQRPRCWHFAAARRQALRVTTAVS